ncbi:OTU domain-containing protein 5-A [Halotydeus destructor]|nr:OTU domain-containing protein 5-A [Halotydeus destructor]
MSTTSSSSLEGHLLQASGQEASAEASPQTTVSPTGRKKEPEEEGDYEAPPAKRMRRHLAPTGPQQPADGAPHRQLSTGGSSGSASSCSASASSGPVASTSSTSTSSSSPPCLLQPRTPDTHRQEESGCSSPETVSGYNSSDEHRQQQMHQLEQQQLEHHQYHHHQQQQLYQKQAQAQQWTGREERRFEKRMRQTRGLRVKKMAEDGACLFRAVADQVYGDQDMHALVRQLCMDYMAKNGDYFGQWVTEDFGAYLARKRRPGCHGNHLEIQAISELFGRPVEVYDKAAACGSSSSSRSSPPDVFRAGVTSGGVVSAASGSSGGSGANSAGEEVEVYPIRLAYSSRGQRHYDSLVDPFTASIGVGLGLPSFQPGLADRQLVQQALVSSEQDRQQLEHSMLQDKLLATDWEATSEAIEEQVARDSYVSWQREQQQRAKSRDDRRQQPQQPQQDDDEEEDSVLARVLALSHREYLESLASGGGGGHPKKAK